MDERATVPALAIVATLCRPGSEANWLFVCALGKVISCSNLWTSLRLRCVRLKLGC